MLSHWIKLTITTNRTEASVRLRNRQMPQFERPQSNDYILEELRWPAKAPRSSSTESPAVPEGKALEAEVCVQVENQARPCSCLCTRTCEPNVRLVARAHTVGDREDCLGQQCQPDHSCERSAVSIPIQHHFLPAPWGH